MRISVTGHRPKDLFGYDLRHPGYDIMKNFFYKKFDELALSGKFTAISGGAQGVDQIFAWCAVKWQAKNPGLLHNLLAMPCAGQSSKWPLAGQKSFENLRKRMDEVIVLQEFYTPDCMDKRNQYMVNNSDIVLAVWTGKAKGGTANCVRYADKVGKNIIVLHPETGEVTFGLNREPRPIEQLSLLPGF